MSKKSSYAETAAVAAALEKAGDFAQAAHFWRQAQQLALSAANENWCSVRTQLCEMRC